jgi:hypothetical protein
MILGTFNPALFLLAFRVNTSMGRRTPETQSVAVRSQSFQVPLKTLK